ncbi:MAG: ABC transporter ATP-binding protein [Acetobacteraceae bacterium]|nr:ABC transporter ATP-binding protein [Acetobacteraceae bacterium]
MAILVEGVAKRYISRGREVEALAPVTMTIEDGAFVAFLGPSGCGKSTLLNIIAGLLPASAGRVVHDGAVVSGPNRRVGYMTQVDSLLPWRTAEANVGLGLELQGVPKDRAAARIDEMLRLVKLEGFRRHFPAELSGGMRKRVALAQVLAYDPGTLLMDEPFGALDAQLKLVMQHELLRIWENTGKTVIFVTHDIAEAVALADRVVVFSARPGRVSAVHEIDLPRPRDVFRVRFQPRFQELCETLWAALEPDMLRQEDAA